MRAQIEAHRWAIPGNQALKRSTASLIQEWCGHNLLYRAGLFRSHTESVDFEDYQDPVVRLAWFLLSLLYWH